LAASDGGRLSFARLDARDVQLAPFIKDDAWPTASHIEAKALAGDLPDPKTSEKSRMKFRLDHAAADFSNFVDWMPTKFSARIDHAFLD
ncbi:MAG: hypothetical protein N2444_08595, partial [Methylocystis sp.]|nr:hypothetical protein [Methylocystis sp.]